MKQTMRVIWIDDDPGRREDVKNLESASPKISAEWLHPSDFGAKLDKLKSISMNPPDIFLVDFYLEQKAEKGKPPFPHLGLTVGAQIREVCPEHPIYLVTARQTNADEAKLEKWAPAVASLFDRVLTLRTIQRSGKDIVYHDARDYGLIRASAGKGSEEVFKLLKAPRTDLRDRLMLILPDGLRDGIQRPQANVPGSDTVSFARWVRNTLLSIPGFLYDELHAATYLGMTAKSFEGVTSELLPARYSGVFSKTWQSVWWVSKLSEMLFSRDEARQLGKINPWEIGPEVFSIPQKKRSTCAVCERPHPETVGTNLSDESDVRPVHYRCSEPDPHRKKELYFDEPRAFKLGT